MKAGAVCVIALMLTAWVGEDCLGSDAEPCGVSVKLLRVIVEADTEKARFSNVWMFSRADSNSDGSITVELPKEAFDVEDIEGAQLEREDGVYVLRALLDEGQLVEGISFSYYAANRDGRCIDRTVQIIFPEECTVVRAEGIEEAII